MEPSKEYHDPDYPEVSASVKKDVTGPSEAEKVRKIKAIVRREFSKEIEDREQEIKTIDQRVLTARQLLHRLRCVLVTRYYQQNPLKLPGSQVQDEVAAQTEPRVKAETSALLRDGQRRLHPSVRKLVGKKTVDLDEIFRHRSPRKKSRPDYNAMLGTRNYTIVADKATSLRPEKPEGSEDPDGPSRPKRIPRQMDPKKENVLTLDEVTRNRQKHRFRIIIGNTSKYAPAASVSDASTHKWLLYVRHADVTSVTDVTRDVTDVTDSRDAVVTAVSVELHHSYAPHHKVHIVKPPYHVSRRGWGEFPAKVTLHFALPERNKPATIEHNIKLDRNYTGLQTLGAETIVDVWLYSTEEMLKYEFKEEIELPVDNSVITPKTEDDTANRLTETPLDGVDNSDSWLDFFKNDTSELDVDQMLIKAVKADGDLDAMIDSTVIKKEASGSADMEDFDLSLVKEEVYDGVEATETQIGLGNVNSVPKDSSETPKKKIMKYMDPITGKIYYLEMDRALDLSKVQEIVINSRSYTQTAQVSPVKANGLSERKQTKKGISLLKPELSNQLKNDKKVKSLIKVKTRFKHIQNDHCYLGDVFTQSFFSKEEPVVKKMDSVAINVMSKEVDLYDELIVSVKRFDCVRVAVNYLLSKIPLVSEVRKSKHFPFVVENDDVYWKLDFAKRRNIEWSRAKLINRILTQHTKLKSIWRTKQILLFSRLHGYYPIRREQSDIIDHDWSVYDDIKRKDHRETIPCSLTLFNVKDYPLKTDSVVDLTNGEEVIDVVCDSPVKVKSEMLPEKNNYLQVLPVEDEDDRLRFMFIEKKCADIGIELRNEDVGSGYSYSAVHAVILSAVKSYAEDVIRSALAAKLTGERTSSDPPMSVWSGSSVVSVCTSSVLAALRGSARLQHAGSAGLAALPSSATTDNL